MQGGAIEEIQSVKWRYPILNLIRPILVLCKELETKKNGNTAIIWRVDAVKVDSSLDSGLAVEIERTEPIQNQFGGQVDRT